MPGVRDGAGCGADQSGGSGHSGHSEHSGPNGQLPPVRDGYYRGENWNSDESIGYLMRRAIASVKTAADERMVENGLTDAQWQPLLALAHQPGCTATDISRHLHCDSGALTRMLDRLEEKRLIARTRSSDDRRVVHLRLTEEGERAAGIVPYVLADVLNAHLADFSRAEVDQLKDLLRRFITGGSAVCRRRSKESP
jgi:DNA-binding MarR family transcriptional regulator